MGLDIDPPRRRHPAEFHRVDPRNRDRTTALIRGFRPTALVHLGVYEPFARTSPRSAAERTAAGTVAAVTAAVDAGGLDRIVVRSGIEVYGRRRGARRCAPTRRCAPIRPARSATSWCTSSGPASRPGCTPPSPVTCLRFAPLVGPHSPARWAGYLRMPAVPFSALADPPFSLLHQDDAAAALLAALRRPVDGPVNVVGAGRGDRVAGGPARSPPARPHPRAGLALGPAVQRAGRRSGARPRPRAADPGPHRRRQPGRRAAGRAPVAIHARGASRSSTPGPRWSHLSTPEARPHERRSR